MKRVKFKRPSHNMTCREWEESGANTLREAMEIVEVFTEDIRDQVQETFIRNLGYVRLAQMLKHN